MARKKEDERAEEEKRKNPIQLTYDTESVGLTKEEYLANLKQASRKVRQPDSEEAKGESRKKRP